MYSLSETRTSAFLSANELWIRRKKGGGGWENQRKLKIIDSSVMREFKNLFLSFLLWPLGKFLKFAGLQDLSCETGMT